MNLNEFTETMTCAECGGPAFTDLILAEKKDACYAKVRSRYKVWPSAYASGALVQCRKKGADNWGNKSKNESLTEFAPGGGDDDDYDSEDVLFRLAQMWYTAADEATEQRAEQTLAKMGWEIGGLESEEGGAFVMEIGDDEGHSYIAWSAEDLEQGLAEMDKSQPSHGRDGKISHSSYGSRDKGGSTGPERTAKATTADKMMKHAHDVMMKSMSDADKVKKGWRNPNVKEQGVAEGLDDDESVLGHFAEVLADELGYDPDEVADSIVAEMTTPSGIEVYSYTDDDQTYYMGVLRRGKGSAIVSVSHAGGGQDNELEIYGPGENLKYVVKYGRTTPTLHTPDNKVIAQARPGQDENDLVGVALDMLWGRMKQRFMEFAPVSSGGDMPPRGPKTPGRDRWGGDDDGEDPYSRPDPRHYSRSIDFFGRFEADHFDEEVFDDKTGVFKGYWFDREAEDGKIQIAYFKFDDPRQAARDFDDSPGMGWYYEPMDENLNELAPAGGVGGNIPRGPKTPRRGPWDDSGEDPYQLRRYNRSADFFDQFDSNSVDKQNFDKATGEYEGYYFDRDAASGITQIAYFKFDDPAKIGDNDPGMGWYHEPMDESVNEGGDVFDPNIKNTPAYKAGFATGKLPVPHPEGTQEYAAYYKGVIDKATPTLNKAVAEAQLDEKCWDTHRQAGMKKKGDRMVPNCVPKESIEEGEMDLNKLRDAAKTAKPVSKLDKDKKQQQKKGAMDLSTLRAAAKTARPASELGEDFDPEYDDEAGMADNNLETLERAVQGIDELISAGDNLPEWCQEKIANAKGMLVAVWDYMRSEEDREEDPEDIAMYEAIDTMARALARKYSISLDEAWSQFEALPDHVLYETAQYRLQQLNEDWQKVNKQDKTDGMSRKAVKAYRRENPGSKLKTAVTTKPSKLKKGSKAAKRRKSFCSRMRGMKKSRASAKTKRDPNSPINKALRRWNC